MELSKVSCVNYFVEKIVMCEMQMRKCEVFSIIKTNYRLR